MEEEIWKNIEGFPGYQVSDLGHVKSLNYRRSKKERILRPGLDRCGYLNIFLSSDNEVFTKSISTLVWDAFSEIPRNGRILQVDHKDNDKLNNRFDNLQLLNHRENISKRIFKKEKSSKYTGVAWDKQTNKWRANIQINGKGKYLGRFITQEAASEAYQNALSHLIDQRKLS